MGEKAHVLEESWGLLSSASPTLCFAKDGAPADASSKRGTIQSSGNLDRAYQLFLLALGARMLLR
jgi:hypothetical protein